MTTVAGSFCLQTSVETGQLLHQGGSQPPLSTSTIQTSCFTFVSRPDPCLWLLFFINIPFYFYLSILRLCNAKSFVISSAPTDLRSPGTNPNIIAPGASPEHLVRDHRVNVRRRGMSFQTALKTTTTAPLGGKLGLSAAFHSAFLPIAPAFYNSSTLPTTSSQPFNTQATTAIHL